MWKDTKINDLKYKINEDEEYLKSYYRKAFISYFESKILRILKKQENIILKNWKGL